MINKAYIDFAEKRLQGNFGEMSSWSLVFPYLQNRIIYGGRCLDIGCADGLYLKYLGRNAIGLEQVPELAKKAKDRGLKVVTGDVSRSILDFVDSEFDVVLFSHVMKHVDSPITVLREIWRVLKVNGILVLGLPIERNLYRDLLRMDYFCGTHIYAFSVRNALKLLGIAGFKPVRRIFHLPKCRGRLGTKLQQTWNSTLFPFQEYLSMAYWIVAEKQ